MLEQRRQRDSQVAEDNARPSRLSQSTPAGWPRCARSPGSRACSATTASTGRTPAPPALPLVRTPWMPPQRAPRSSVFVVGALPRPPPGGGARPSSDPRIPLRLPPRPLLRSPPGRAAHAAPATGCHAPPAAAPGPTRMSRSRPARPFGSPAPSARTPTPSVRRAGRSCLSGVPDAPLDPYRRSPGPVHPADSRTRRRTGSAPRAPAPLATDPPGLFGTSRKSVARTCCSPRPLGRGRRPV